ncbi:hypothetical protein A3J23_00220 [Candidatus Peregrinibacteria bacterium RIFCSPLOWO2_02_FULL_48_14]|nr:MAG: hypothetical protein A2974_03055 [Candidatus Peregrinibacteria bacterium RIFCSPLOWO2_01_FULL_48_20]OGJ43642.1 MAG: hypothetical protein A3J23_00220 [Candidatus Peregrinibacteria bacterium RIFCSPLOWO2_02_FULL_48_14]
MKKSYFGLLSLFLLSGLLLSGCEKLWEWPFGSEDSEITYDDTGLGDYWGTSPTDATSTLNRYTDLINDVYEQIKYLEDDTYYFEAGIADYDTYGYEPYFSCYYEIYDRDALYDATMNPVGLTVEESADLTAQATAIFAASDNAEGICKELGKYVTAQDYKDDDFAAGLILIDEIYTQTDAYYDLHNALLDKIDTLFDAYNTWEVDISDPTSVGIDNMNKDLDKAEAVLDLVEDAYLEGSMEGKTAELQALYDELSVSATDHTSNAPDVSDYVIYYYEDFYSLVDGSFLPTTKRALRSLENSDLDALGTDYYDILDTYNLLVDDYNYYLDSSGY